MPVVINEFELIAKQQPPPAPQTTNQSQAQKAPQSSLRPTDILQIQEWQQRRWERIFAD